MKTRFFPFVLLALFLSAPTAFSQRNSDENRPQAYLVSAGDRRTAARPARPATAYLVSRGDARSEAVTRPRVYKTESAKTVPSVSTKSRHSLERATFDLINEQRAQKGLEALRWSDEAAKIARAHSENMANYNFFSHTGRDGSLVNDRADAFGVSRWRAIGENIAYNQGFENPVEFAVERWMLSQKHRDNLLSSRWQESGIGIAVTENGTYYFTEVFLARK